MKTEFRSSEFNYTAAVKVPINYPITAKKLALNIPLSGWSSWDMNSFKVMVVRSGKKLNEWKQIRGTSIWDQPNEIEKFFE